MLRETTAILERTVNGGMHRQKAYRRIKSMLDDHGFTSPRLYHFVLMDNHTEGEPNAKRFLRGLKALCRELHDQGLRYRWRAALELDDEKGLHLHTFMLIENEKANPCSIITPIRNTTGKRPEYKDGSVGKPWRTIGDIMAAQMLSFYIAKPRDKIHETAAGKRLNYATLGNPARKADCLVWMSYMAKARSKPDHIRGIYFSSRDSRKAEVVH